MLKLFVSQAVGSGNLESSRETAVADEENVPAAAFEMAGPTNAQ